MTRKNAIIILILVIIASLLYFLYSIFFTNQDDQDFNNEIRREFGSFFPTSENETQENIINDDSFQTSDTTSNQDIPKLRKITSIPTSGATIFNRIATTTEFIDNTEKISTTTETVIRYSERATGHIYETLTNNLTIKRISNTSIPKNYNVEFNSDGSGVLYTTNNTINNFFEGNILEKKDGEETGSIVGNFLPNNTLFATKFNDSILYSNKSTNQKYGSLYNIFLKNKQGVKSIFNSPMSEWLFSWINSDTISLLSKPSYTTPGYYYEINLKTGENKKYLDEIFGLNTKSNNKYIIYSNYINNKIKTYIFDKQSNKQTEINISTLPREKCVFSKNNENIAYCGSMLSEETLNFPDNWYLGIKNSTDFIYKINLETGTTNFLGYLDTEKDLDIYSMNISPDDKFLLFINKRDLSLWSLEI